MAASRHRLLLLATVAALALLGGSAQARQVHQYFYSGTSFDAGGSSAKAIAFDAADQKLLVVNGNKVVKFDADGFSDPFTSPGLGGASSFTPDPVDPLQGATIAVDNSGTATDGNFYLSSHGSSNKVYGYTPDGIPLSGFPVAFPGALCGIAVAPDGHPWLASSEGSYREYTVTGSSTGKTLNTGQSNDCRIDFDSAASLYVAKGSDLEKYAPDLADLGPFAPGTPPLRLDRSEDTAFTLAGDRVTQYDSSGNPITAFGGADPAHFSYPGLSGAADLAVNPQSHDVYVLKGSTVDVFSRDSSTVTVPDTTTAPADGISATGATLHGTVNAAGIDTTDCHFEWGATTSYGKSASCLDAGTPTSVFSGSGNHAVTADLSGLLTKGTTYHFRLVAKNANDVQALGRDASFNAADPPLVADTSVDHITTDSARVGLEVNPNGGPTSYHVEFVDDATYQDDLIDLGAGHGFDHAAKAPVPDAAPPSLQQNYKDIGVVFQLLLLDQNYDQEVSGLSPATTYHYRVVATNPAGVTEGSDHTFTTYALPSKAPDACPNALARQQTGSSGLLDCRAYELVSAAFTGGYDVRSDLTPGIAPLPTSPAAADKALYSMRSGTIPGIAGAPTNRGADPYLATRDPANQRWDTTYVGLPSTNPYASGPFASPLSGFDANLDAFAFAGPEICVPCFADGSTNVPLRLQNGSLVQGMAGPLEPGPADPSGTLRAPLSADGTHLVFGSTAKFIGGANNDGTDATIYDRDLLTGKTQVASKLPTGATIKNGLNVAELGISADGSRIVIGKLVSTDAAGNHHYHLYMHVGKNTETIDLTPGATHGVIYAGMTEDASMVYFTTPDPLLTAADQDSDESADLYRAEVGEEATAATLTRVSTGDSSGDTDSCDPAPNSAHAHWNSLAASPSCDVLAIGGGGGVASASGAVYFFSPERLDTSGPAQPAQDAPNLYRAAPGSAPRFVTTLESSLSGPQPPAMAYRQAATSFPTTFSRATGVAVEHASGNVYVLDIQAKRVLKFNASGNPVNFTAGQGKNTNALSGADAPSGVFSTNLGQSLPSEIAVDQASGSLYVPDYGHNVVDVFASTGAYLSQVAVTAPSGVAVNPSSHNVYVSSESTGKVFVFTSAGAPVTNFATIAKPTGVAVGSTGTVYVVNGSEAAIYDSAGKAAGVLDPGPATAVTVDPANDDVFVDEETQFVQFDSSGNPKAIGPFGDGEPVGAGALAKSVGIAVDAGRVYASNVNAPKTVSKFTLSLKPRQYIDSPLLLDSLDAADARHPEDFQATPSGEDAAFVSSAPFSGFDGGGREEVFRYDTGAGLDCVSCSATGARPLADATLSAYGSSLTDDGRVFFTSTEPLVLRDANENRDAYEYSGGTRQLVSTGNSPADSSLLSVSSDGTDAFFFTRQQLAQGDENGSAVRLYDAREEGGFAHGPPEFECAASDECHGAGTQTPPPASIGTLAGSSGNAPPTAPPPRPCRKGKVRRRGRCVPRHPHKHHHKRAQAGRGSAKR